MVPVEGPTRGYALLLAVEINVLLSMLLLYDGFPVIVSNDQEQEKCGCQPLMLFRVSIFVLTTSCNVLLFFILILQTTLCRSYAVFQDEDTSEDPTTATTATNNGSSNVGVVVVSGEEAVVEKGENHTLHQESSLSTDVVSTSTAAASTSSTTRSMSRLTISGVSSLDRCVFMRCP